MLAWIFLLLPVPFVSGGVGWPLNLVAFILAIVAMSKGGAGAGIWQLLGSIIGSGIVYLIGLMLLGGMVAGSRNSYSHYVEKAKQAEQQHAPAVQETSDHESAAGKKTD